MKTLQNNNCIIEYREEKKEICGRDFTDQYNLPAFFTKTKRGIKKAWEAVEENFNTDTRMNEVIGIIYDNNVRVHQWCMMD